MNIYAYYVMRVGYAFRIGLVNDVDLAWCYARVGYTLVKRVKTFGKKNKK